MKNKIAVIKAPYTIRTHLSGAASLHIGHIISILKQNNNLVQYCDYNIESFFLWSRMVFEVIEKLLDNHDLNYMIPTEILLLVERIILENKFGPSEFDISLDIPLSTEIQKGLVECLDIAMGELVDQIGSNCDEVIIFVSPSIFFHLILVKKIKETYPNIRITLMDEFTFEPATPYFYYLITGDGIHCENLHSFYLKDSYNKILKTFILENINQIVIGEGYDFLFNNFYLDAQETLGNCHIYKSKRIDLDVLPLPCFDDMVSIYDSIEIEFTRGCSYRCEFCERTRMMENTVSKHSIKYIITELKYLQKYNFDYLTIIDCSVNLDENYMMNLLKEIKKHNIFMKYQCNMRGKKPNDKLLGLLKDTGCFEIAFGIETIDNGLLKDMNKCQDVSVIADMVSKVDEFGISLMLFLILGFPTEKYAASQKTIKFLIELNNIVHIDVVELEIYHPGIIQHLNPSRYDDFHIEVTKIRNIQDIKKSSLTDFRPGMACGLNFKEGMNRVELKKSLLDYIRECKKNNIYLETFFGEILVNYYE